MTGYFRDIKGVMGTFGGRCVGLLCVFAVLGNLPIESPFHFKTKSRCIRFKYLTCLLSCLGPAALECAETLRKNDFKGESFELFVHLDSPRA